MSLLLLLTPPPIPLLSSPIIGVFFQVGDCGGHFLVHFLIGIRSSRGGRKDLTGEL